MFSTVVQCADQLSENISKLAKEEDIDAKK